MFSDNYEELDADEMCRTLAGNVHSANIPCMVVTMGDKGAVYARSGGECGTVPAKRSMSSTRPARAMPFCRHGHRPDLRQDAGAGL